MRRMWNRRTDEPENAAPGDYETGNGHELVDDEYEFDEDELDEAGELGDRDHEELEVDDDGELEYEAEDELEFEATAGGRGENEEPVDRKADRPNLVQRMLGRFGTRARALWATLLAQARGVELPGTSESQRRLIARVALVVSACLLVGVGGYLIGKGTGDDLDAARQEGELAGRQAGAIQGASEGYPAGFRKGRARGFRKAYVRAYRIYYIRAYEQAGQDPPPANKIEVPRP